MSEEEEGGGGGRANPLAGIGGLILIVVILNGLSYAFDWGWMFY